LWVGVFAFQQAAAAQTLQQFVALSSNRTATELAVIHPKYFGS
jgi:hypothetical protein